MDFAKLLKSGERVAERDKYTFERYAQGQISLGQCINEFSDNNEVRADVTIKMREFAAWLASLGYTRD